MVGCTMYSAVNLVDGYYQLLMRASDISLITVSTPRGMLWEWLVMPNDYWVLQHRIFVWQSNYFVLIDDMRRLTLMKFLSTIVPNMEEFNIENHIFIYEQRSSVCVRIIRLLIIQMHLRCCRDFVLGWFVEKRVLRADPAMSKPL